MVRAIVSFCPPVKDAVIKVELGGKEEAEHCMSAILDFTKFVLKSPAAGVLHIGG